MKRNFLFVALVVVSGFIGGVVANRVPTPKTAIAQEVLPEVVSAKEFQLIDEQGRKRADLNMGQDMDIWKPSPTLSFYDEESRLLIQLKGGSPFSKLTFFYPKTNKPLLSLFVSDHGASFLNFSDEKGEKRLGMGVVGYDSTPEINFFSEGVMSGTKFSISAKNIAETDAPE